jgi:hypothetical protein
MNIDLSTIESQLLQALGIVLMAGLGWVMQRVLARLKISLSDAQKAEMEDVAGKALTYGITQAQTKIKAQGWDSINVKDTVVATAAGYMVAQFPGAMANAGFDISTPQAAHETTGKLMGILTRKFPEMATVAAASPATPPAPASIVPAVAIVVKPAGLLVPPDDSGNVNTGIVPRRVGEPGSTLQSPT